MKKVMIILAFVVAAHASAELSNIEPYAYASEAGYECGLAWTIQLSGGMDEVFHDIGLAARSEYYALLKYDALEIAAAEGVMFCESADGSIETVDPDAIALVEESESDAEKDGLTWVGKTLWSVGGIAASWVVYDELIKTKDPAPTKLPDTPPPADGTRFAVDKNGAVLVVDKTPAVWLYEKSPDGTIKLERTGGNLVTE